MTLNWSQVKQLIKFDALLLVLVSNDPVKCLSFRLLDPRTKRTFHVRVAFQVWLKPGSYKVGPQSLGLNEQIDPQFPNNELEWSTKECGSVLLHGLLVKIENL